MKILTLTAIIIMTIILLITMVLNLISKKSFYDREKNCPFECGFNPQSNRRLPFSLQFFLIAIIFLIFDVEISLLIPITQVFMASTPLTLAATILTFLSILLMGLMHEWSQGALDWAT